jgi:hypothetical protein
VQRQLLIAAGLTCLLALVPHIRSYTLTIALLSLAMFVTPAFVVGALSHAYRHYSMSHSGLITGLASGTWSGVVALVMPVVGRLFDLHNYGLAFVVPALLPAAGFIIWRGLDWYAEKASRSDAARQFGFAATALSAPVAGR